MSETQRGESGLDERGVAAAAAPAPAPPRARSARGASVLGPVLFLLGTVVAVVAVILAFVPSAHGVADGTVIDVDVADPRRCTVEYAVDGESHHAYMEFRDQRARGEHVRVAYNKDAPAQFSHPHIERGRFIAYFATPALAVALVGAIVWNWTRTDA